MDPLRLLKVFDCSSIGLARDNEPVSDDDDAEDGVGALMAQCTEVQQAMEQRMHNLAMEPAELARKAAAPTQSTKRSTKQKRGQPAAINFNPPLPAVHDKYTIVKGVTQGSLRMARHKDSNQKRGILALPRKNVPDGVTDDLGAEIRKHIETLLKVDHINVLTLHEACEDEHYIYLVYDWPDGGLMVDYLTHYHEDVTEAHIASIIREVIAALGAASHFRIHHLDWSLLCLFLGYKNRFSPLKLFGLGLAGYLVPVITTRKVSRSNKHFYCSPELLTENYRIMPPAKLNACDIWSVGCVLYMLFSGRPPFFGQPAEVEVKIKKAQWAFGYEFDGISREAKHAIELMLKRKWESRPPAAELLKLAFFQAQMMGTRSQDGGVCQDALGKLDQFARETHCKQTLARLLADLGLQEHQYAHLEEEFRKLDLDGNGVVDKEELQVVAASFPGIDAGTVNTIIAACDRNTNNTVDILEFIEALVLELDQKDERLVVKAFEKMDIDGDARITKGEMFRVLRQYSQNLDPTDISAFVKDVDRDKDQKIDYNEFKNLFSHVKERDEAVKTELRLLREDEAAKREAFKKLIFDVDVFFRSLKERVGQLVEQGRRLRNASTNEHAVLDRLQLLTKAVEDFAQREKGQKDKEKAGEKAVQDERSGVDSKVLVGLTVMHKYNRNEASSTMVLHRSKSSGSNSASSGEEGALHACRSSKDTLLTARPASAAQKDRGAEPSGGAAAASAAGHPVASTETPTVAEIYLARDPSTKYMTRDQLRKECERRRRYFWFGMGDGVRHVRSWIRYDKPPDDSPRSGHGSPRSAGGSARSPGRRSPRMKKHGGSPRGSPRGGGAHHDEETLDLVGDFVPWTSGKKLMLCKHAMAEASGPLIDRIGSKGPEETKEATAAIGRRLLHEHGLSQDVDEKLCDLTKLTRYKCARSWLPVLQMWKDELQNSTDESRGHIKDRRESIIACTQAVAQLCERIMFSLADLIMSQDEVFAAMWKIEEMAPMVPVTKRFLPFRQGEVDKNARTPRDQYDAENLAPAEPEDHHGTQMDIADMHGTSAAISKSEMSKSGELARSSFKNSMHASSVRSVEFAIPSTAAHTKPLTRSTVRAAHHGHKVNK